MVMVRVYQAASVGIGDWVIASCFMAYSKLSTSILCPSPSSSLLRFEIGSIYRSYFSDGDCDSDGDDYC